MLTPLPPVSLSLGLPLLLLHSSSGVYWQCCLVASFYPWRSQQLGQSGTSSVRLRSACSFSGARAREALAPSAVSWTWDPGSQRRQGVQHGPRAQRSEGQVQCQGTAALVASSKGGYYKFHKGIPLQICPARKAGLGDGYSGSGSSSTRKVWATCP